MSEKLSKTPKFEVWKTIWKKERWFIVGTCLIAITWGGDKLITENFDAKIAVIWSQVNEMRHSSLHKSLTEIERNAFAISPFPLKNLPGLEKNVRLQLDKEILASYYQLASASADLIYEERNDTSQFLFDRYVAFTDSLLAGRQFDSTEILRRMDAEARVFQQNNSTAQKMAANRMRVYERYKSYLTIIDTILFIVGTIMISYSRGRSYILDEQKRLEDRRKDLAHQKKVPNDDRKKAK